MNKKIIFLILILLSCVIDVKALDNVLEIDGRSYVLNKDIKEEYYSYTVSNNTLVLNNYKGSHIYKEGVLNVIVKGNNYISDENGVFLIRADNLIISGDGTLNFDSKNSVISANDVSISDVTIRGTSARELVFSSNELNINNVDIDFEAKGILIFGGKIISINNSVIKSSNRWGFRYTNNGFASISNSEINMECSVTCISATAKMTFNKTNAYFYGKTSASSNMELSFEKTSFVISEDGVNYRDSVDYNGYPYLKTVSVVNDEINQDDNSNKDNEIEKEESSFNSDNSSLDSENDSSIDKNKDELNKDNLYKEDQLIEDASNVPNQDNTFDDSNDNTNDKTQNNNASNSDLNNNSYNNQDNLKDNVDNEENNNIYTEGEYQDKDDIYTKNEYDKDNSLNIENPQTYDGILNSIIILMLSLSIIIASIIIMKRNANGKI